MNKVKKNNIVNFPGKITEAEREVEAIIFAAAEPLSVETIESKIKSFVIKPESKMFPVLNDEISNCFKFENLFTNKFNVVPTGVLTISTAE